MVRRAALLIDLAVRFPAEAYEEALAHSPDLVRRAGRDGAEARGIVAAALLDAIRRNPTFEPTDVALAEEALADLASLAAE